MLLKEGVMLHRRAHDRRLNLSSNELDHPDLGHLLEEALRRVSFESVRSYPNYLAMAERIAGALRLPAEEVTLAPGSDAAIRCICRRYRTWPGANGRLLLHAPNYYAWEQAAAPAGLDLRGVGWRDPAIPAAELLDAAAASSAALIAVSVPNGPTGLTLSCREISALIEVVERRRHYLVIDACYAAFAGMFNRFLRLRHPRVLVVQSLSKSHGLAGARIAIIRGSPALTATLADERLEHAVSMPAMLLAAELLELSSNFSRIWRDIADVRDGIARRLSGAGVPVLPSRGNFLAFSAGDAAAASKIRDRLSARGYRLKSLSDAPGFSQFLRMTVAGTTLTSAAVDATLDEFGSLNQKKRR